MYGKQGRSSRPYVSRNRLDVKVLVFCDYAYLTVTVSSSYVQYIYMHVLSNRFLSGDWMFFGNAFMEVYWIPQTRFPPSVSARISPMKIINLRKTRNLHVNVIVWWKSSNTFRIFLQTLWYEITKLISKDEAKNSTWGVLGNMETGALVAVPVAWVFDSVLDVEAVVHLVELSCWQLERSEQWGTSSCLRYMGEAPLVV